MDQIRKQVARARRRLWMELFLSRLVNCWFVALIIAAVAIALPKFVAIANLPANWTVGWLGGSIVAGLVVALVWTWLRGRSELEAAMEIDRRFELKERVASSLSLPPEAAETPAGRALLADAMRAIGRLEIDQRFRINIGRSALLPLVPALLAGALVLLVDNKQAQSSVDPATTKLTPKALENSTDALRKKLVERRKEAAKKGLKEAEELLLKVDKDIEKLAVKKDVDRKQALVKMNDLAKQLAERREKLGGDNELKKQLAGMKDFSKGPAEKMVEAMKTGDWQKAQQELNKLKEQLKAGKLDGAGKKELQKQLSQLQKKLDQASAEKQQAMSELKKQIAEQKKKGNLAEAGQLQQKLDQMQKQQQQSKQMQQMAQKLAEAQQAMQKGDQQAAAQAMEQMAQQMEQMQKEMGEGEMLDMAMEQLEMAKTSMNCSECMGEGCKECQGNMSGRFGQKPGTGKGNGMGAGRGQGPRPDEKNDVAFRDSQVKQNPGKGAAVITGEADGPNIRGDVRQAIQEEMTAQASEPADPLVVEQLPKTQRENAEDYFNRLRDGE
jgi:septal ring factor EnvC (AmiA/AmiB activator)